jgi:hypothetical protein
MHLIQPPMTFAIGGLDLARNFVPDVLDWSLTAEVRHLALRLAELPSGLAHAASVPGQ